jgi:RHS repeat-associated protein
MLLVQCPSAYGKAGKNKSGVAPQVLTLPKGGGAVKGLGETFTPNLNSGTGAYRVPLALPAGRNGYGPSLALSYSSGRGNGPVGMGWDIGASRISRRTEKGIPQYDDDTDLFIFNGMELIQVSPGKYRPRHEGFFGKIFHRRQDGQDFWEVWTKGGEKLFFGSRPQSKIENNGDVFAWCLTRQSDANGNEVTYTYRRNKGGNLYLSRIDYAIYAIELHYESRPDSYTHFSAGFGIRESLRCTNILVRLDIPSERRVDRIRRYALQYRQSEGSGMSLLSRIVQYGTDDSAFLPSLDLEYTQFDPKGSFQRMASDRGAPPQSLADPNYELADVNADGLADVLCTEETGHLYWLNTGEDAWLSPHSMRRSPPGVQLSDDGVLLSDMDGDGKSDLLQSHGTAFGYWRSYGNKDWEEFIRYRRMPNFSFKDPSVRMMDVNGDGLTDVIRTTAHDFTFWLNLDGKDWALPVSRKLSAIFGQDDGPPSWFSDNPESDARLADMNGDGLQDLVSVHNGNIRYWPHRGYLRFAPMVRMTGTPRIPRRRFHRQRFLTGDINNDGFADLLYVDVNRVYYWFNLQGSSWSEEQELKRVPYAQGDADVRLADMNGNGTRDLVWSTPARSTDRTNYRYFDFVGSGNFPNLLTGIDNNMGMVTRIVYKPVIKDFIASKREGQRWEYRLPIVVKVVESVTLIDRISHNEVKSTYGYADGYYDGHDREFRGFGRAEAHSAGDESSPDSLVKHTFYVGYAEGMSSEKAAKMQALAGQLRRREVYGLDGTELEDKPYEIVTHYWDSMVLDKLESRDAQGRSRKEFVVFPTLRGTLTSAYERTDEPRHAAIGYSYSAEHGGTSEQVEYGEVQGWGEDAEQPEDIPVNDMRITRTQYAIRDNPQGYVVQSCKALITDRNGSVLGEIESYYDGEPFMGLAFGQIEKGNLHRVRERGYTPDILEKAYGDVDYQRFNDIQLHEWIDTDRFEYSQDGLLKSYMDAKGTVALRVEYDKYRLFPVRTLNALDHEVKVEYDYLVGQITRHIDANGAETHCRFGKLGMVERVVKPYDSMAYPTLWYRYNLHIYGQQAAKGIKFPSPPYVTTWAREQPPEGSPRINRRADPEPLTAEKNAFVTRMFFDGFGRTIQSRAEDVHGKVRVSGWTEYNAKGKAKTQYLPFFVEGFNFVAGERPPASTGERDVRAELSYDPLGRLVRAVNPNGTHTEVRYSPLHTVNYDEEDTDPKSKHFDTPTERTTDAYGRLTSVTDFASREKEPIITRYAYDLNDNLIEITDATGKEANKRHIVRDLYGRMLRQIEPNTGTRVYFYDQNGNMAYRRDGRRQWIKFEYDSLNRMTDKWHMKPDASEHIVWNAYDRGQGRHLVGRRASVTDPSGLLQFSYDQRGRVEKRVRRINGLERTFTTERIYDSMNGLLALVCPDRNRTSVRYNYDEASRLKSITGHVDEIAYNPKNQRANVRYANGVTTHYTYEPLTFRLRTLLTTSKGGRVGDIQHDTYVYDRVGNITNIQGRSSSPASQSYTYDSLYRLAHAQKTGSHSFDISYAYNSIGNMTGKSDLTDGEMRYDLDGRPHTLDRYGGMELGYDDNGNLVETPTLRLAWDYEDQLVGAEMPDGTKYVNTYDAGGERVIKEVKKLKQVTTSYYVDPVLELRADREVLFVFDDKTRISRIVEGKSVAMHHTDHLGSVRAMTDAGGASVDSVVNYKPFGEPFKEELRSVPGKRFMDKEMDAETGLYYFGRRFYSSQVGRWTSADPLIVGDPQQAQANRMQADPYSFVAHSPVNKIDERGLLTPGAKSDPKELATFRVDAKLSKIDQVVSHPSLSIPVSGIGLGIRTFSAYKSFRLAKVAADIGALDDVLGSSIVTGLSKQGLRHAGAAAAGVGSLLTAGIASEFEAKGQHGRAAGAHTASLGFTLLAAKGVAVGSAGSALPLLSAGLAGYSIGTALDKKYRWSDRISDSLVMEQRLAAKIRGAAHARKVYRMARKTQQTNRPKELRAIRQIEKGELDVRSNMWLLNATSPAIRAAAQRQLTPPIQQSVDYFVP